MHRLTLVVLVILWIGAMSPASAQPPPAYALAQNDPDPFCDFTAIRLALPVQAEVTLTVWDPDSSHVVRTLIHGLMAAGYHEVIWDGLDDQGSHLGNDSYPYVLTVIEIPGDPPAFVASLRATIDCPTPTRTRSWGVLRELYRISVR